MKQTSKVHFFFASNNVNTEIQQEYYYHLFRSIRKFRVRSDTIARIITVYHGIASKTINDKNTNARRIILLSETEDN